MNLTRHVRALVCAAALTATALVAAPPSGATVLGVTCLGGTKSITYDPGLTLTLTQQDVGISATATSCSSTTQPTISYGTYSAQFQGERSCLEPLSFSTGTTVVTWRTAAGAAVGTSTVDVIASTITNVTGGALYTRTGTVTSGLFAGQPYVETAVFLSITPILDCLGDGLTRRDSVVLATTIGV